MREHPFFASVNWDELYNRNITPPFTPTRNQTGPADTSNFEKEFTNMQISMDAGGAGPREDKRLDSDTFVNFTFEEESQLDSLIDDYHSAHSAAKHRK